MTSSRRDFLKGMAVSGMATVGAVPAIASAKQDELPRTHVRGFLGAYSQF